MANIERVRESAVWKATRPGMWLPTRFKNDTKDRCGGFYAELVYLVFQEGNIPMEAALRNNI